MAQRETKLSEEDYDRLSEIAVRRLAELEFDEEESELILGLSRENKVGSTREFIGGWSEDKGVIAGATWSKRALEEFIRDAHPEGWEEDEARADLEDMQVRNAIDKRRGL